MVNIEMDNTTRTIKSPHSLISMAMGLLIFLSACSSNSPEPQMQPQPMSVKGKMSATTILNPDLKGGYRPLNVKVFYLKSDAAFSKASFTDIYKHTDQILGPDILHITSHQLLPGQALNISETVPPGLKYIGVVGAFRNLDGASWKDIKAIPLKCEDCEGPGLWNPISIKAQRLAIYLDLGKGATIDSQPSGEDVAASEIEEQPETKAEPEAPAKPKAKNSANFSKKERR